MKAIESYTCPDCGSRCLDVSTKAFTSFYCEKCEVTYTGTEASKKLDQRSK